MITAVLLLIGWAAYGAHVPGCTGPALFVTVAIGALSFCCIGYALASLIHDEDAAQPVKQALVLPLYFISGVFVAVSQLFDPGSLLSGATGHLISRWPQSPHANGRPPPDNGRERGRAAPEPAQVGAADPGSADGLANAEAPTVSSTRPAHNTAPKAGQP